MTKEPLTQEQLQEAIQQMITHCDLKMASYESVSARSVLYELGYQADVDQVLRYIADRGFEYCLDHEIECSSGLPEGGRIYPDSGVCWWGPDQLKSRLWAVR